ncbi:uncharacterized protein LOC110875266 [Helianthus annuus]|uniref:uncharacterized protein LOC110875266 n=1 Tax=Helianthus annuus TaxID=4232 RepID=UPI000B8F1114|nr:uncharacterized protein LOC110875266 [Helianthus annuus]
MGMVESTTDSEKMDMDGLNDQLMQYPIRETNDMWYWKDVDQLSFTIKAVRETLAQQLDLNIQGGDFVWNKWPSSKSNMFAWRAIDNNIPTATTLGGRGLILQNNRCRMCDTEEETTDHVLLQCSFAKQIWEAVLGWVKYNEINLGESIKQVLHEVNDLQRGRNKRKIIHAFVLQTMWRLWKVRNDKIFNGKTGVIQNVIEGIKEESYQYVKERSRFKAISREQWWDFNFIA